MASQAEISKQAHIMATMGTPIEGTQVISFPRFFSLVMGKPCCDPTEKNGHITPDNAALHGQDVAVAILASLPADMPQEEKLAKVQVQVTTKPRFKCTKGCPFGHKLQAQAQRCSDGSQSSQAKSLKAAIQVDLSSLTSLSQALEAASQTPEAKAEAAKAEAEAEAKAEAEAAKAKAEAEAKAAAQSEAAKALEAAKAEAAKAEAAKAAAQVSRRPGRQAKAS